MDQKELKMQLLEKFGHDKLSMDFIREAYKFLVEGEDSQDSPDNHAFPAGPVAVDLGLPSGKLWADRNLGAATPEDYGAFFSWGNIEPHYPDKKGMDWGDAYDAFDYSFNSDAYENTPGGKLDGDIDEAHDAATALLGKSWCMPTDEDFQELYDNCTWERKTVNGINGCVNGYLVTSKLNGNTIFFACSGGGDGSSWVSRGSNGGYWSASFLSARFALATCSSTVAVWVRRASTIGTTASRCARFRISFPRNKQPSTQSQPQAAPPRAAQG